MGDRTRTAGLAAAALMLAAGVLAAGTGAAGAVAPRSEGRFPIAVAGCHVTEIIQLEGSTPHDYMGWETTGDSTGCSVWMWTGTATGTFEQQVDLAPGYHHSNMYYDGPGLSLQVCVHAPDAVGYTCGPWN